MYAQLPPHFCLAFLSRILRNRDSVIEKMSFWDFLESDVKPNLKYIPLYSNKT